MSKVQNSSRFCMLCFNTIACSSDTKSTKEDTKIFVEIVCMLAGKPKLYPYFNMVNYKNQLECCYDCNQITEGFYNSYIQFKEFDLQLEFLVDKLVEKIKYATGVHERWVHVNKTLKELLGEHDVRNQYFITEFHQCLIEFGQHKNMQTKPHSLVTSTENVDLAKQTSSGEGHEEKFASFKTKEDGKSLLRLQSDYNGKIRDKGAEDSHTKYWKGYYIFPSKPLTAKTIAILKVTSERIKKEQKSGLEFNEEKVSSSDSQAVVVANVSHKGNKAVKHSSQPNPPNHETNIENRCPKCGKLLNSAKGLSVHMRYHVDPKYWKWNCETCPRKFPVREHLRVHMKKEHEN